MSEPPAASEAPVVTSTEGVHAEPRKTGHRLLDFTIALSAIVISLVSLAVGIHHGRVQERLVAANSWPFLRWETSNDHDEQGQTFSIYIQNSGMGPALLKGLVVRYRGQPVHGWLELLQKCCGVEQQATLDYRALGVVTGGMPKGVILPGERRTLIKVARLPQSPQIWERLGAARHQLAFQACYCSIIGDCWTSDLRTLDPQDAAQCRGGPEDYIEVGAGFDDKTALPVIKED